MIDFRFDFLNEQNIKNYLVDQIIREGICDDYNLDVYKSITEDYYLIGKLKSEQELLSINSNLEEIINSNPLIKQTSFLDISNLNKVKLEPRKEYFRINDSKLKENYFYLERSIREGYSVFINSKDYSTLISGFEENNKYDNNDLYSTLKSLSNKNDSGVSYINLDSDEKRFDFLKYNLVDNLSLNNGSSNNFF